MNGSIFHSKSKAFTLIEMIIVLAVIGFLVALAIPNILRSRIQSNESMAKTNMKAYIAALENYRSNQSSSVYPPDLTTLSSSNPPYLDSVMTSGVRTGYRFTYSVVSSNRYTIIGTPLVPNVTGVNTYFVDESGVIRLNDAAGNPIQ